MLKYLTIILIASLIITLIIRTSRFAEEKLKNTPEGAATDFYVLGSIFTTAICGLLIIVNSIKLLLLLLSTVLANM